MDTATLSHATATNEDCTLHFWHLGSGPLLILIPGGAGYGSQFFPMLPHLAAHYTACTFDRRQHNLSQLTPSRRNQSFNPVQQCRDIISIAAALGHTRFCVFGNSLGGVLALQLAASYPEHLEAVVVHEAPTMALLPREDMNAEIDFYFRVDEVRRTEGAEAAMAFFAKEKLVGYENVEPADPVVYSGARKEDQAMFVECEYVISTVYCPDLKKIREAEVSIAVASGTGSWEGHREAAYVRTGVEQARLMGCERWRVPGNHTGFAFEPEAFAGCVLKMLEDMR